MNAPVRTNPYLSGNFAPVRTEDDFSDLPVKGIIHQEISGSYYRNGPNPQVEPRDPNHHWVAGDGMVHAFHIGGGKVSYRNRYVHTNKYEIEKDAGRSVFGTFGNPMTSRSRGRRAGQRCRQHQYRLAWRQASGARRGPQSS